ncbi:MAG: hypothetical protein H8D23_26945 [Candidatus Brocadiales bacterium]|nr:hypothetical protein [Candidatus Brocadiales bacterium]
MTTKGEIKALKLGSMEFRIQEFVRKRAERIARETIGFEIQQIASNMGMSSRYIDAIKYTVEGIGHNLTLKIDLDYFGKDGEPLGYWFEFGTKDHWIEPIGGTQGGGGRNTPKVLHWTQGGQHFFSKGHMVSGIKPHKIFDEGKTRGMPEFLGRLKAEIEDYQQKVFA